MTPIYRAKKIDSDEYVEGYYTKAKGGIVHEIEEHLILPFLDLKGFAIVDTDYERIDQSTLAIHFPDMIDSEGTKIFASLGEDGRGGDIVVRVDDTPFIDGKGNKTFSEWVATYESCRISFCSTINSPSISYPYFESNKKYMKVTGIQE